MRWFAILVAAIVGMGLLARGAAAESVASASIESITFDNPSPEVEKITFKLSELVEPKIFVITGDKPRLVVDFPESTYRGENVIDVSGGTLVQKIRIGLHREPILKTRVVIDLAKSTKVHYTHTFSVQEKTLAILLSPQPAGSSADHSIKPPATQPQSGAGQAPAVIAAEPLKKKEPPTKPEGEKDRVAAPLEENPSPPSVPAEAPEKDTGGNSAPAAATPQLLDVSFDDSSNTGEMVLFHLNDFYPPTVSAIEKEKPRVICDFLHMRLAEGVRETIDAGGKFVKKIRVEKYDNPDKVRIILDLSPERDYDLQQVFFKNDNLFVLIVNELSEKKVVE